MNIIKATGKENKVIYVYHHPESVEHEGWLKIGDQTGFNSGRIQQQNEADNIRAETLYMTPAIDKNGNPFRDYEVHAIIDATGKFEREKKKNSKSGRYSEWYKMTKKEAVTVIEARKNLKDFNLNILKEINLDIKPRDEQQRAIQKTFNYWKDSLKGKREFLWNAKPRFGKTLTSYWFMEKIEAKKVLVVTNRPAISDSWYEDYREFIQPKGLFKFGSTKDNKNTTHEGHLKGRALNVVEAKAAISNGKPTIFFISLQDIKGREADNPETFKAKNQWIFNESWDLFIIDESHEATETDKAHKLFKNLKTGFTLHLSGTPFKALADKKFNVDQIFNWTYEDEQSAKENWDPMDGENPYYELPKMNMFAYRLSSALNATVSDGEYAFDLNELFKTSQSKFVYEEMVLKFLDNMFGISSKNDQSVRPFPFADPQIRDELRHTFWLLPGVSAVKALKKLMQEHGVKDSTRKVFADYEIIDASAKGDDEHEGKTALEKVKRIIGAKGNPLETKTITLSCGQLTTGVTIKPWTAVLMLYGAEGGRTSATRYLQAAFRGQNPWRYKDKNGNDIIKENCYVFDFAPDRLLLIFQDYAKSVIGEGVDVKAKVRKLLNFLTVVAEDEYGEMKELDANEVVTMPLRLMTQEIVDGKFITSNRLFNIGNIFHLPAGAREILNEMGTLKKGRIEHDKNKNPIADPQLEYDQDGNLILNESNLGKKKYEEILEDNPDLPSDKMPTLDDLIPSDAKTDLEKLAQKEKAEQENAIHDHLRYFARAIPMILMAYGKSDTKLENFEKYIDSETFTELVGITKDQFKELRDIYKLFNEEVFNSSIIEFLNRKAELADYYENDSGMDIFDFIPPQQTNQIYTPKAVVKMMVDILEKESPGIFKSKDHTFLDPYMKSGLYITEIVKRLYNNLERQMPNKHERLEHILTRQVYGFTPTKILHLISNETIFGFMHGKPEFKKARYRVEKNFVHFEDEDSRMLQDQGALKETIDKNFGEHMKFTAIIGNPPYQLSTDTNFATPVYHLFFEAAKKLQPDYISLIHPARFLFNAGATPKEWNKQMLNDKHLSISLYESNSQKIFSGVDIKGGVCVTLWNKNMPSGGLGGAFIAFDELRGILNKVKIGGFDRIVGSRGETKLIMALDRKYPNDFRIAPNYFERFPKVFLKKRTAKNNVKIIGLEKGNKRTERFVDISIVNDPKLNKWKVFLPKSNGSGALGEVLSTPLVGGPIAGEPLVGCTYSFLQIGSFDSQLEADNCLKYIKTKFCRALLGTLKVTQDNPKDVWKNVPIQDFSKKSDIDWAKPVAEIDKQLYKKYKLDKKEVDFIETHIKAMA